MINRAEVENISKALEPNKDFEKESWTRYLDFLILNIGMLSKEVIEKLVESCLKIKDNLNAENQDITLKILTILSAHQDCSKIENCMAFLIRLALRENSGARSLVLNNLNDIQESHIGSLIKEIKKDGPNLFVLELLAKKSHQLLELMQPKYLQILIRYLTISKCKKLVIEILANSGVKLSAEDIQSLTLNLGNNSSEFEIPSNIIINSLTSNEMVQIWLDATDKTTIKIQILRILELAYQSKKIDEELWFKILAKLSIQEKFSEFVLPYLRPILKSVNIENLIKSLRQEITNDELLNFLVVGSKLKDKDQVWVIKIFEEYFNYEISSNNFENMTMIMRNLKD